MGQGFRRATRALALAATLGALGVPVALAGATELPESIYDAPDISSGQMVDETSEAWFVQLAGSKKAFRDDARAKGVKFTERFAYDKVWNGVSVKVASADVGKLSELAGVGAVYPVLEVSAPETSAISPDLATAIAMTGADVAQSELGLTGAGVRVAVMDTGIDYDHADLGGCFGAGCRVAAGYDFVGDAFNADSTSSSYNPTAVPDDDPDDCQGHGTHVAGIVGASPAAEGGAKGVAPGVTFGAYRVFGCEGSTTADIMLAAMERALEDGMDVLNMSIGSAFNTWPQYPTAAGSDALVDAGMVVVASIGNSGANGVYSAGAPGVGNKVIGVASFDNSHINALTFRTNPANTQVAYLQISNTAAAPTSGTTPDVVWYGRGCTSLGDAPQGAVIGKVALIIRGDCTFDEKYQGAVNNGAAAVVIYNQFPGLFAGGGVADRGVPAVGISNADGLKIRSELASGPVTLTWTADRINAVNPSGGRASSFTSFGLTAELKLKPNIGAPGGLIRSTYPLEKGTYAILSGTSMASPHVAGGVALLLEAKPGTSVADVKTLFQNSADPVAFPTTTAFRDVVHRQGAGMLDIDDSILATTTVTPSEISVGEGTGTAATLTITNNGSSSETYTLSHTRALSSFGSTNAPSFTSTGGTATLSPSSLTLAPGESGTVAVSIGIGDFTGFNLQYGGYVNVAASSGKTFRVPYAGLSGDYQAIRVLTPTGNGFPWLAKRSGGSFVKQSDGAVYTMEGTDVPFFLVHFEHQARAFEVTILDAATGHELSGKGRNPNGIKADYLPRNSTSGGFFAFAWDGALTRTTKGVKTREDVPDGTYKAVVKVLKALGDPANPAHTETWTSPAFTIDRP